MINWQNIFPANTNATILGTANPRVKNLQINAQLVREGDVFIAQKGQNRDGHEFILQAIENGARVIVCETLPDLVNSELVKAGSSQITYCQVADTQEFAGLLFRNRYPELQELKIVGVTGTNGKTTVATLLYQAFRKLGYKTGLLSTVKVMINDEELPATHTTPDIATLYSLLAKMHQEGCCYVFMECSSHAIVQNRIGGLSFAGAVFTNLTHDHLDYHGTFQAYIEAKKSFFDKLDKNAFALSNIDDKHGTFVLQNTKAKKYSYALKQMADFNARILVNNLAGLTLEYQGISISTRLLGYFNAYNLLAVYGVCELLLGLPMQKIWLTLSELSGAEGRLQVEKYTRPVDFLGIVDYAHTPDALEKTLRSLCELRGNNSASKKVKIWIVFGCGGDRDRLKRPLMSKVALRYADRVIFTADNPRNEPIGQILADMCQDLAEDLVNKYKVVPDRREAIEYALKTLKNGDILLIAGKGHEKYQEIAGKKYPFDDRAVLNELSNKIELN